MEYGIYEAYLKQPEKFFAPACPIKLTNRTKSKKVQTSTPPQETLSSYYSMLLTQLVDPPSEYQLTPEVTDDPEIKLYLKEHIRWKAMQQKGFVPQPLLNEWFDTEENRNPILNKIDLTLPIPKPEENFHDKSPRKYRTNSLPCNKSINVPNSKGTTAPLHKPNPTINKGVVLPKLPDLNYDYIRPRSKKYTEYLSKRKPVRATKVQTVIPQALRLKAASPTKTIMNLTFSNNSATVVFQPNNMHIEVRNANLNSAQENFEEIITNIQKFTLV